jgi:tetratricopeptide (TPR) repeat protein
VISKTQTGNANIATRLRGTENLDAYHAYLKGRSLLSKRKADSIEPAIIELSHAVDLDPMYGNAWGALGLAHLTAALWGITSRANSMMIAKETSIRAIGYAPQSQLGYETLSQVQARYEWDFEAALSTLRAGLEVTTEADHQLLLNYADLEAKIGNTREALVTLESERTSDPLNPGILRSLCLRYIEIGDIGRANASLVALLELDPNHSDRYWLNSKIHLAQKRYQDALVAIANDDLAHLRLSISAIALFHLGKLQDSESVLQELIKEDGEASAFQVAEVYAQRADLRSALHWLEVAYSKRDPGLAELISSTHFKPLYQESEFREFARRVGFTLK